MNIFKKKIVKKCNHKFVYYNKDIVSKSYSLAQYEFSFVCTLCERVYKISYNDILSLLSKLKEDYNKKIVLKSINKIKTSEISIPVLNDTTHLYISPYVTLLIDYYNTLGINILEISVEYFQAIVISE